MNPMEADFQKMTEGLNGMVKGLESMVNDFAKHMTPKEAAQVAKQMQQMNVADVVGQANSSINELKSVLGGNK